MMSRCSLEPGQCAKVCATVEVEEDTACSCSCLPQQSQCDHLHTFNSHTCSCHCTDTEQFQMCRSDNTTFYDQKIPRKLT